MPATSHPERRFTINKNRRHNRNIRQMCTAVIGRIEHICVAICCIGAQPHDRFDTVRHRPKMHGHVRGIGNQITACIKDRTREVQPLFDVHGPTGVGKRSPHFICDRHEQIAHDLKHNRIGFGASGRWTCDRADAVQNQISVVVHDSPPSRFNHIGPCRFQNDRRAHNCLPNTQRGTVIDRRGVAATAIGHISLCNRHSVAFGLRDHHVWLIRTGTQCFCADHFKDDLPLWRRKTETLLVHGLECRLHRDYIAKWDLQRLVRPVIAHMGHSRHSGVCEPLGMDLF